LRCDFRPGARSLGGLLFLFLFRRLVFFLRLTPGTRGPLPVVCTTGRILGNIRNASVLAYTALRVAST